MTEIFTAKTVEEAKALAVKKFGRRASEIRFEVIEEGRKGFLGIGQVDAKVKATYIAPAPKPEPKKQAVAKPAPVKKSPEPEVIAKPEPVPVVEEAPKPAPIPEPVAPVEAVAEEVVPVSVEETAEPVAQEVPVSSEPVAEVKVPVSAIEKDDEIGFTLDDFTVIEDETLLHEKVKIARDYIISILKAMDVEAEFVIYQNETGAVIDIKSNNNGTIIGRRGETLDSIQYLCSIIANKGDKDYFRITIDCLGYRNKRKETLQQLAAKVAKSVLRTGRSQQLEPMNPYERRVIHSAVSEIEGVSSRSVGEEPYRKIIISSNTPKNGKRRGARRDDKKGGGRRNDRPRTPREPLEVKEIDLSTSFEKDYKKPKPEDTMEGGLYGKIELF
ncbi:MAG: Jag N-terminal domain-containing protein [Ruminococcus flavefaciens]|nr:Jag N-terminal domain-containing protein [Ruminococcus flavefaciens]MCM1228637.1 Jag N-terminal domain-containing protein [Ruminococcus flavefaciens]